MTITVEVQTFRTATGTKGPTSTPARPIPGNPPSAPPEMKKLPREPTLLQQFQQTNPGYDPIRTITNPMKTTSNPTKMASARPIRAETSAGLLTEIRYLHSDNEKTPENGVTHRITAAPALTYPEKWLCPFVFVFSAVTNAHRRPFCLRLKQQQ
jgi:hypothetical protein